MTLSRPHHLGGLPAEGDRIGLASVVISVLDATETRVRRLRVEWTLAAATETDRSEPTAVDGDAARGST